MGFKVEEREKITEVFQELIDKGLDAMINKGLTLDQATGVFNHLEVIGENMKANLPLADWLMIDKVYLILIITKEIDTKDYVMGTRPHLESLLAKITNDVNS